MSDLTETTFNTAPRPSCTAVVYDAHTGEIVHTHVLSSTVAGASREGEAACHEALEVAALLLTRESATLRAIEVTPDFDRRWEYKVDVTTKRLVVVRAGSVSTVKHLVEGGRFDEAVERYQAQRQAAAHVGERADQMVRRLNTLRHDLQKYVDDEERRLEELMSELKDTADRAGFDRFMRSLIGDGGDFGEAGALVNGLRNNVLALAVVVLLRAAEQR
jgi:nucleotide-binding universal stress UspA family protein